jgi:hypothetical protein
MLLATKRQLARLLCCLLMICLIFLCSMSASTQTRDAPATSASALWERMIEAKGGRERLRQIENVLITTTRVTETERPEAVELIVFPNLRWLWSDQRDSVLGKHLSVLTEKGTWEAYYSPRSRNPLGTAWFPRVNGNENAFVDPHIHFLLETKWLKPILLRSSTRRIGREDFNHATAEYRKPSGETRKVEFYVDRKTPLVRRAVVFTTSTDFFDYKSVEGVMVPSRVSVVGKPSLTYPLDFEFNVAFDPEIFKRMPSLADGPNGWKLRPLELQLLPGR